MAFDDREEGRSHDVTAPRRAPETPSVETDSTKPGNAVQHEEYKVLFDRWCEMKRLTLIASKATADFASIGWTMAVAGVGLLATSPSMWPTGGEFAVEGELKGISFMVCGAVGLLLLVVGSVVVNFARREVKRDRKQLVRVVSLMSETEDERYGHTLQFQDDLEVRFRDLKSWRKPWGHLIESHERFKRVPSTAFANDTTTKKAS